MIHVIYATSIDYDFLSIQQYCTFIRDNKEMKSYFFVTCMFQKRVCQCISWPKFLQYE